jgi:phosphoheptose isomerase
VADERFGALARALEALTGDAPGAAACAQAAADAAEAITDAVLGGGKLLAFGNGGSAADAQHVAAELVGRFVRQRAGLPAVALTTDSSALTSVANDFGYEQVFARQVEALAAPGDVVLAISASGGSPNVLAALDAARTAGALVVGLTGGSGGELARRAEIAIVAPASETARVQECHLMIEHAICDHVDAAAAAGRAPAPAVVDWEQLDALRAGWRRRGMTVAWTNGVFDLVHAGHLRSLQAARALGDVLVVGINDDESVRRLKGPERPLMPAAERAELLAALTPVDHVVVFGEDTPEAALDRLRPEVHCKGADYAPPDGRPIPERAVVEAYGGRVEFLPLLPERSTTELIERIAHAE